MHWIILQNEKGYIKLSAVVFLKPLEQIVWTHIRLLPMEPSDMCTSCLHNALVEINPLLSEKLLQIRQWQDIS